MSAYKIILLFFSATILFSTTLQAKTPSDSIAIDEKTTSTYTNLLWKDGVYPNGASGLRHGGAFAVLINGSINSITNSDFINNQSDPYGAGIENYNSINSLDNLLFLKNRSKLNGGAIANTLSKSTINSMSNIIFNSNEAGSSGGAIFNSGTIKLIDNSIFIKNISQQNSLGGGAIFNSVGNNTKPASITITNSVFDGNKAKSNGGAIYNDSVISLTNTSFMNNTATTGFGGAIFNTTKDYGGF